jgi:hypothetical protein
MINFYEKLNIFLFIVNIIFSQGLENKHSISFNNDELIKINILLLLPINNTYKFSLSKVLPSLYLAVDHIQTTDYGSRFDIKIIPDTCDCTGITAPVNAMEQIYGQRNHSLHFQAVFGPMCD